MAKLDYRSVIVITGPSGVGKGTLIKELRSHLPELAYSVSATTRPSRPGEQDGVNYHFLSTDEFAERVTKDEFIEHAIYSGNQYGTLKSELDNSLSRGRPVILEIELDGARQIGRSVPDAFRIFITPPSVEALRARLIGRGTDDQNQTEKRLKIAEAEIAAQGEFDAVVLNDRLEEAVEKLTRVVSRQLAEAKTK